MSNLAEAFDKMSKKELIAQYPINGHSLEPLIAAKYDLEHNKEINGVDAFTKCKNRYPVEIKTQVWTGNYLLRGRAKYTSPSLSIYRKKMEVDETQLVSGVCAKTHIQFYDLQFLFSAIQKEFLHAIEMGWGNCDVLPKHYAHHESFNVLDIETPAVLMQHKDKFTQNFYKRLLKLSEEFYN
jgi:hypothetical protein